MILSQLSQTCTRLLQHLRGGSEAGLAPGTPRASQGESGSLTGSPVGYTVFDECILYPSKKRQMGGLYSVGCPEFSVRSPPCSFENGIDLVHSFLHFTTMLCHHLILLFPHLALKHFHFLYQCVSMFLDERCSVTVV